VANERKLQESVLKVQPKICPRTRSWAFELHLLIFSVVLAGPRKTKKQDMGEQVCYWRTKTV
jgi:hypothetical protein